MKMEWIEIKDLEQLTLMESNMRISADKSDPDFIGVHNYGRYAVRLDQAPLSDCLEADDEACYAVVFIRDKSGHFVFDMANRPRMRRLDGKVQIIDTMYNALTA